MKKKFLIVIRWIFGVFMILLPIGAFSKGDIVADFIVLISGLPLIPPVGHFIATKFRKGFTWLRMNRHLNMRTFINDLDIENDNDLIQTIDGRLNTSKRSFNDQSRRYLGKSIYKKIALSAVNSSFNHQEKNKLKEVETYFQLSEIHQLRIRRSLISKALSSYRRIFISAIESSFSLNESAKLKELTGYFQLPGREINKIKKVLLPDVLGKIDALNRKVFESGYAQPNIHGQIEQIAANADISFSKLTESKEKVAREIIRTSLSKKLINRKISPSDESEVIQETKNLHIAPDHLRDLISPEQLKALKRAKLLWQLENGIFYPQISQSLTLQKSESCYISLKAALLKLRQSIRDIRSAAEAFLFQLWEISVSIVTSGTSSQ